MQGFASFRVGLAGLAALALAACSSQRTLMPTPNIYTQPGGPELFVDLPESLQSYRAELIFVTDRMPERDEQGAFGYGHARSLSTAFGTVTVAIGPEQAWPDVVRASLDSRRGKEMTVDVMDIREHHRFPPTPLPGLVSGNKFSYDPEAKRKNDETVQALRKLLIKRLEESPRREVIVYVHGFNNQFHDAAEALAEFWHFNGRKIVPIVYSWPAGRGGASGYIYDRESGEFTVWHLKNLLKALGGIEEIEKVHLLAHSRGTDVLSSAVRELMIETLASGRDPLEDYRVGNLMLAAPDLDMDVVSQRMLAEHLGATVGRITIYSSQEDRAVGFAEHFFDGRGRIGTLSAADLSEEQHQILEKVDGTIFIEYTGRVDATGHGYFLDSPAASSDLILTLRYDKEPGEQNGWPLRQVAPQFWELGPGYPGAMTWQP